MFGNQAINLFFLKETGKKFIRDYFSVDWENLLKIDELNADISTKMY